MTVAYARVDYFTASVACDCGQSDDGAAVRSYHTATACERHGNLEEDHHYELDAPEGIEDLGDEEDEYEVLCPDCLNEADQDDWEIESHPDDSEEVDTEVHVWCGDCGREIEFGWSHPDRGGRIWPAECNDFNRWRCWPEPRFIESWHAKGWLRPLRVGEAAARLGHPGTTDYVQLGKSGPMLSSSLSRRA